MGDDAAHAYVDGLDAAGRSLFDRLHRLIMDEHPGATTSRTRTPHGSPTSTCGTWCAPSSTETRPGTRADRLR